MIDIDEITRILEKKPLDEIIYSREKGRFLTLKEMNDIDPDEENDDFCYFTNSSVVYRNARSGFKAKHQSLFPKAPSSYSPKKWFETIEEASLEEEWFLEFRQALAENVTTFSKYYGIQEVEAPSSLYKEIKKELVIFKKKHYEKRYPDCVLFKMMTSYEIVPFEVLGNAGDVFGVSFHPSDEEAAAYYRIQLQEDLDIDLGTLYPLSNMLSFYFEEKDKLEHIFTDNPYGKDNLYTSCYMTNGSSMNCYLPKSIAIRALDYLKTANRKMPIFDETKGDEIIDDGNYEVLLYDHGPVVFPVRLCGDMCTNFFPEFEDVCYPDPILKITRDGAFDATVRVLPNYFNDEKNPERCIHMGLVVLMADHDTHYLHVNEIGEAANFRLFDDIYHRLAEKLEKTKLPKTIYVNNYLDLFFFRLFFAKYIKSKKIEVIPVIKRLSTDEAYEELIKFLDENEEFMRGDVYQS